MEEVEAVEKGLMLEAQRFFVLAQTDNLWKEHLQVGSPVPLCTCAPLSPPCLFSRSPAQVFSPVLCSRVLPHLLCTCSPTSPSLVSSPVPCARVPRQSYDGAPAIGQHLFQLIS